MKSAFHGRVEEFYEVVALHYVGSVDLVLSISIWVRKSITYFI